MDESHPDGLTLGVFGVLVLIGGTNFVAARFSNMELAPFWGAGVRLLAAAVVLLAVAGARRLSLPQGSALRETLVYGALAFFLPYALMYYALVRIPAGPASFVMALVPLLTFFLAFAQGLEPFRWRGLWGALLSVLGIGLMVRGLVNGGGSLTALAAMLAAALVVAEAGVFAKRVSRGDPITTNLVAMATGAVLLLTLSGVVREAWLLPSRPATWIALAYLVLLGTSTMFVLFLFVIRRWTASATSYSFVLFPIVASTVGALLAGEVVTSTVLTSGLLVLAGVYVGALARPAVTPAPAPRVCPEPCVGT